MNRPAPVHLASRPIAYKENGFRIVSGEETLKRFDAFLLSSGMEIQVLVEPWEYPPFSSTMLEYISPFGHQYNKVYLGKGDSDLQCRLSASMEFLERTAAQHYSDDDLFEVPYEKIPEKSLDPKDLCLPTDSCYSDALPIDWVWGYSLTRSRPLLVPANAVFCPYFADTSEKQIMDNDSNGLASGNCLEEAVFHGLMELIERDHLIIMEYNQHNSPDVISPENDLLARLDAMHIRYWVKDVRNDISIPSFGVLLEGEDSGETVHSFSVGTHLDPDIALSRAVTEALQLYPRSANYEKWLSSAPIDHLYQKAEQSIDYDGIANLSSDNLLENIQKTIAILKEVGSEVIVVDLSLPDTDFSVVRVIATKLQPVIIPGSPRFSQRLFHVPVDLGWREKAMQDNEIHYRHLCGYAVSSDHDHSGDQPQNWKK